MAALRILRESRISGPVVIRVGSSTFAIPADAKRVRTHVGRKKTPVSYVVTAHGRVHVFVERGEVVIDRHLETKIAERYFAKLLGQGQTPLLPPPTALTAPMRARPLAEPALRVAAYRARKAQRAAGS